MAAIHFVYFLAELIMALIVLRLAQVWGPTWLSNSLGALHS